MYKITIIRKISLTPGRGETRRKEMTNNTKMQWTEYVSNLARSYKSNKDEYDLLDSLENTLTIDGFPTLGSVIASRLVIVVFNDSVKPPIPTVRG